MTGSIEGFTAGTAGSALGFLVADVGIDVSEETEAEDGRL